ncbi:MAG: DUF2149 domain-containing protein [Methanosarcinales archaeon]|nr:DUF2149 domain-containing protein [Methanosarcinales archaeon]
MKLRSVIKHEIYETQKKKKIDYENDDPMSGVANLFDVAMIFAIGLLVVALTHFNLIELISDEDVTIVKNPDQENMEVIIKHEKKIEKLNLTQDVVTTSGTKFGTIYETDSGGWVLVKDESNK